MPVYEGIGLINEKLPVVLEIGQALTKAGFAGENSPRCIIPSVKRKKVAKGPDEIQNLYEIKDESDLYLALVEFLHLIYFKYLLVTPKDRKIVIIESLFTPTKCRNTLARVLYLHYEVLNVLWMPTHLSAVVCTGEDTALVLDIGKEEANVIPLVNGVTLLNHVVCHELGASAFDKNLKELLISHSTKDEKLSDLLTAEVLEDIRVRSCIVAPLARAQKFNNPESLAPKLKPFQVELNGKEFQTFDGIVRELAAEFWFNNEDLDGISIPMMILEVISKCPVDTRKELATSIFVCGGTAVIPGFKGRLLRELKNQMGNPCFQNKFNNSYEFRIFELPAEPNCASWFGGSVYGSSEAMGLRGISKEYFLKAGELPDWSSPTQSISLATLGVPSSTNVTPNQSPSIKIIH